ncbi:hypothetical protein TNCV_3376471 [Trichonephila clavipes]|nr:hypothetical protein TNCV_3376471 [Trichonephila clavipes]
MSMLLKRYCSSKSLGFGNVEDQAERYAVSGIKLWDYERDNLENKSKQEVIVEESSKEGSVPRGAVLPDKMMIYSFINLYLRDKNDL